MINPKECKRYAKGGYCCFEDKCLRKRYNNPQHRLGRENCNLVVFCGYNRTRCHVTREPNVKCISFQRKQSDAKSGGK